MTAGCDDPVTDRREIGGSTVCAMPERFETMGNNWKRFFLDPLRTP